MQLQIDTLLPQGTSGTKAHTGPWYMARLQLEHFASRSGDLPSPGIPGTIRSVSLQTVSGCAIHPPTGNRELQCLSFSLSVAQLVVRPPALAEQPVVHDDDRCPSSQTGRSLLYRAEPLTGNASRTLAEMYYSDLATLRSAPKTGEERRPSVQAPAAPGSRGIRPRSWAGSSIPPAGAWRPW